MGPSHGPTWVVGLSTVALLPNAGMVPWPMGTSGHILPPPPPVDLPQMKATFDGDPKKLAFFLSQVWAHLHRYAPGYPLEVAIVNAVAANVEGEAQSG